MHTKWSNLPIIAIRVCGTVNHSYVSRTWRCAHPNRNDPRDTDYVSNPSGRLMTPVHTPREQNAAVNMLNARPIFQGSLSYYQKQHSRSEARKQSLSIWRGIQKQSSSRSASTALKGSIQDKCTSGHLTLYVDGACF